jgi:hypothetical protein
LSGDEDPTKALLEKLVADLYGAAAEGGAKADRTTDGSYLEAANKQFLGKITSNVYDTDSILNQYGPYGSQYSGTSIFNPYCPYGGPYGRFSPENPYTTTPPILVINNKLIGKVSANSYVPNRIPVEAFLQSLRHDLDGLLRGDVSRNEIQVHSLSGDTFIQAGDGTFLGSLNPNKYDTNSLFNRYGEYGNKYSSLSIFNKYSTYGGNFSPYSPYNASSRNPPEIISGGKRIAYLTVNKSLSPRIDPSEILNWAERNVRKRIA